MQLSPFEDAGVAHLAPLAYTRPVFDLRVGARTLLEGHMAAFPEAGALSLSTRDSIAGVASEEHPLAERSSGPTLHVNGRWRATPGPVVEGIRAATRGNQPIAFVQGDDLIALWDPAGALESPGIAGAPAGVAREDVDGAQLIGRLWNLVDEVETRVAEDLRSLGGAGARDDAEVRDGARLVGADAIHLAAGVVVRPGAVVTAEDGPVRVEAGALIEENAVVRGPCWIGPGSVVRAGARVDGSSIGPQSKVGGEVHASVIVGLSNKAHDGYLGNSYLGRWCNLGAGTDTSNLRNDYGEVSLWDPVAMDFIATGRQFLGLIMADHSKCAIGTRFNTGTLVGVSCNWFGSGFPPRRLPSFSWGGDEGLEPYRLEKALAVASGVMARRGRELTTADRALLASVYDATEPFRTAVFGRALSGNIR